MAGYETRSDPWDPQRDRERPRARLPPARGAPTFRATAWTSSGDRLRGGGRGRRRRRGGRRGALRPLRTAAIGRHRRRDRRDAASAEALVRNRLAWAGTEGLEGVYLLTTTAARYFPRLGFERVGAGRAAGRDQGVAGIHQRMPQLGGRDALRDPGRRSRAQRPVQRARARHLVDPALERAQSPAARRCSRSRAGSPSASRPAHRGDAPTANRWQ